MTSLRTNSKFDKPTEYLYKKGVIKLEHYYEIELEVEDKNLIIKSRPVIIYHYKDKTELCNTSFMCATIPIELVNQLSSLINDFLEMKRVDSI